ncbi:MAG: ABC transporter ATP-binding protein [Lachnoanaerobaculum gingivalis]
MLNKVFNYAGSHKKSIHLASFIMLISVLMGVLPFIFAYQIINPLILGEQLEFSKLIILLLSILGCLVLQAVLGGLGLNVSHKAAYNILSGFRVSLQKKMENLPLGVIEEKGAGAIKKMFVDDIGSLEVLLAHSLPEGLANLVVPVIVYITLFFIDWRLALMSLASIPLSVVVMMIMYSVGMKKMEPYYMASGKMNNTIIEYVNGMEVVKVFNKETESYKKFTEDISNYRDYALAWYKTAWGWMALYSALLPCTIILTLPLGGYFVYMGYANLSDLILVLCLSLSIGLPLLKALSFLPTMPQLNYKISALEQALNMEPVQQGKEEFKRTDKTVFYDNVSFGYQLSKMGENGQSENYIKDVIHNVSFIAKSGEKTAIVGESGSGKSTLAKLLIHYYDVSEGSISIGGQNLQDMSLEALNKQISYVAQDQYLFNTSLLENIRVGNLSASDEEVMEAARKARCMEFLDKLPKGIHSLAGEAGKMLSGGERQRISLARAILKNAPIIVLDEATAYADPENEEKMEAAIAELVRGKTLIVIAHKLPSIIDADQILVMDKGYLVAKGKHQDLLESSAEYRKLWNATMFSKDWKISKNKVGVK